MRTKILFALIVAGAVATGAAFMMPSTASAEDAPGGGGGKNLKILPKTMPKAEIKKLMKSISAALGVECEHCHKEDDFAADTEKKEIARKMMTMTAEINKTSFNGKFRVGCITCHNGNKEPKAPPGYQK